MTEGDLHGKRELENKVNMDGKKANTTDAEGDLAKNVREAMCLDYIEGGEGQVSKRLAKQKAENPELTVHTEVDELYPK